MDHLSLLRSLVDEGASDLHCKPGSVTALRREGTLTRHGDEVLSAEDVATLAQVLLSARHQKELLETGSVVGAHSEPGVGRFRVSAFRQRGAVALVVHTVPDEVLPIEALGLPEAATSLAEADRGLVLVASPVGNGVSTTLAAMVDHVNRTRGCHVLTVDDPIEVLHKDDQAMVSQLEVGGDVATAGDGIRAATKVDADVVAVSEIADRDTAAAALDAVARGRLVIGAIGADTVVAAWSAFLELFGVDERAVARDAFARTVAGIMAQQLLPSEDGGRVAAVEVLTRTAKVQACLIDSDRAGDLHPLMEEGHYNGMQTMDQALVDLVRAGSISSDTALGAAVDAEELRIELLR